MVKHKITISYLYNMISIRKASINDYATLIDLWTASGLPYKPEGRDSREAMEKEFQRGISTYLIAEDQQKPIGTVLITHDGRKGWINRLAIIPGYRKRGIARQLITEAEKILDEQGIGIYACLIEGYNQTSLEVFQKLGYVDFEGIHYLTKRKFPGI